MRSDAIIFFPTARLAMSFPWGCVGGHGGSGGDGGGGGGLLMPMTIHMTPITTVAMLMRSGAIIFFPTARLAMFFSVRVCWWSWW
jgi:hypothetical protein